MNNKQLSSTLLILSIVFLAMPLMGTIISCKRNTRAVANDQPAQTTISVSEAPDPAINSQSVHALTGASESPGPSAAPAMLAAFGSGTSGIKQLQGTEKWKKIAPGEIKDNPVILCDNLLAVASGKEGDMNAMTVGWMTIGRIWSDPAAMVYISPDRYTFDFLERNEYFTITAFPDDERERLVILGTQSGLEGDKIKDAGLTVEYTELGNPAFSEGRFMIECRKIYREQLNIDSIMDTAIRKSFYEDYKQNVHYVYIGVIENVWIKE
jgi:flavin reductase (DIM6/NTAB) family NADH-FMN oxidoreductase RutF